MGTLANPAAERQLNDLLVKEDMAAFHMDLRKVPEELMREILSSFRTEVSNKNSMDLSCQCTAFHIIVVEGTKGA